MGFLCSRRLRTHKLDNLSGIGKPELVKWKTQSFQLCVDTYGEEWQSSTGRLEIPDRGRIPTRNDSPPRLRPRVCKCISIAVSADGAFASCGFNDCHDGSSFKTFFYFTFWFSSESPVTPAAADLLTSYRKWSRRWRIASRKMHFGTSRRRCSSDWFASIAIWKKESHQSSACCRKQIATYSINSVIVSLWRGIINSSRSIKATWEYLREGKYLDDELLRCDKSSLLPIHRTVETVIKRGEQPLGSNLLLRFHLQIPRQQLDGYWRWSRIVDCRIFIACARPRRWNDSKVLRDFAAHVVLQDAVRLRSNRVIVEREVRHAKQTIQFEKFQHVKCLK